MANPFAKTDVASYVVMTPGLTAQMYVNEWGRVGHVIGPFDEIICGYCFKPTKATTIGKHQTLGDAKCCPKMRDGSCDVTFKPAPIKGTVMYPHAAVHLTSDQKATNADTIVAMKSYNRNLRNQ